MPGIDYDVMAEEGERSGGTMETRRKMELGLCSTLATDVQMNIRWGPQPPGNVSRSPARGSNVTPCFVFKEVAGRNAFNLSMLHL